MTCMALFWLISRPNSRAAFASTFGMDPPRVVAGTLNLLATCFIEFSDKRVSVLMEACLLLAPLSEPCECCLTNLCERSNLAALDELCYAGISAAVFIF